MRLLLVAVVSSVVLACLPGCTDKPTEAQCSALLDHIIELEVKAAGTGELTPEMKADLAQQRKQVQEYVRKQAVEKCLETMPVRLVECGLKATDLEAFSACEKQ